MPASVTRRNLMSAWGMLLGAAGVPPTFSAATSAARRGASNTVTPTTFVAPTLVPLARYLQRDSPVPIAVSSMTPTGAGAAATGNGGAVLGEQPETNLGSWAPLDPYLRGVNVDLRGTVSPDLLSALSLDGSQRALPLVVKPFCLQYSVPMFPDGADRALSSWSALRSFVASRPPGEPPVLYGPDWTAPQVWISFVLGYGGVLAHNGRVALTDAGALDGLRMLLRILSLPSVAWTGSPGAAIIRLLAVDPTALAALPSAEAFSAPTRFAPLPPMPTGQIVPVSQSPFAAPAALRTSPGFEHAVTACVEFVMWLYAGAQQRRLLSLGLPPVAHQSVFASAWRSDSILPSSLATQGYGRSTPLPALRDVFGPLPPFLRGDAALVHVGWFLAHKAVTVPEIGVSDLRDIEAMLNAVASFNARGDQPAAARVVEQFDRLHGAHVPPESACVPAGPADQPGSVIFCP